MAEPVPDEYDLHEIFLKSKEVDVNVIPEEDLVSIRTYMMLTHVPRRKSRGTWSMVDASYHGKLGEKLSAGSVRMDAYGRLMVWGLCMSGTYGIERTGFEIPDDYMWVVDHICPSSRMYKYSLKFLKKYDTLYYQPLNAISSTRESDRHIKQFYNTSGEVVKASFNPHGNTLNGIYECIKNAVPIRK